MSTMRSRTVFGMAMAVTALLIATACSAPTQSEVASNGVAAITGSPDGEWRKIDDALVLDTATTSGVYPDAPAPVPGSDVVYIGEGSGDQRSWRTFALQVKQRSKATLTLDWNSVGPSNLQVYLKSPDGTLDYARANTDDNKPELATAEAIEAGPYLLAVKIKAGSAPTGWTASIDLESLEGPTTTAPPANTMPPPAVPSRPSAPAGEGRFPGDVAPGYVRWGAAVGGNEDPVARHEAPSGAAMGLRRTYFSWDRRLTSMVSTAHGDIAAGRLPWVSTKTPPWADMASGRYDGEIDSMLRALDNLGGPVWLTLHHEPEGGGDAVGPDDPGGPAAWRGMQIRLRQRMTAVGTKNIAFAPVLMAWTFDSRSNRNPADWWVDGVWDFAGIDHYQEDAAQPVEAHIMWNNTYAFYTAKGLKITLGEWGNPGTDAAAAADMTRFYDVGIRSGGAGKPQVIGYAYFDSDLNSPTGGWSLQGAPLQEFHRLMALPTSLQVNETGL